MDARKILERLKGEADRVRTSLYLSKSIMEDFKKACGTISPSRVMEDLMLNFIDQIRNPKDKESLNDSKNKNS